MRKKFLAVLLSAAMVSGSFAPVYGADFSDGGAAVTEALPEEMTEETAEETPVEAATEEEIFSDQSADTEEFVTEEALEEEIQEGFEAEGTEEETDSQEDVAFTEEESAILEEPEVQEETEQLFADEDAAEAAGAEEAGSEVSSLWISGILYNKVYRVSMYPTRDEVYDDGNGLLFGLSIGLTQADGKQESRWFGDYNPIKKGEEQCYVELLGHKVYIGLCDEAGKVYSPGKIHDLPAGTYRLKCWTDNGTEVYADEWEPENTITFLSKDEEAENWNGSRKQVTLQPGETKYYKLTPKKTARYKIIGLSSLTGKIEAGNAWDTSRYLQAGALYTVIVKNETGAAVTETMELQETNLMVNKMELVSPSRIYYLRDWTGGVGENFCTDPAVKEYLSNVIVKLTYEDGFSENAGVATNTTHADYYVEPWVMLPGEVPGEEDVIACRLSGENATIAGFDVPIILVQSLDIQKYADIKLNGNSFVYNGKAVTPSVDISMSGIRLRPNKDYTVTYKNNVYPGTATMQITGKGVYEGAVTKTFNISDADLKNAEVKISGTSFAYNGKAVTPSVTVAMNGNLLRENTDYTVTYKNNVYPGTATVQITGKGHCKGSVTKTFSIDFAAPKMVSAKVSGSHVKVNWKKTVGARGYYVYRKIPGKNWSKIKTINSGNTVTFTDRNAGKNRRYIYTVRAFCKNGSRIITSGYDSKGVSVTIPLAAPKLVSAKATAYNRIKITWKKVSNARGYMVYRKENNGSWKRIATIKNNKTVAYMDKKAVPGTKYTYTVRAYQSNGLGTYQGKYNTRGVSAKTSLSVPKLVSAKKAGRNVQLRWKKSAGAQGYYVYRKLPGKKWTLVKTITKGSVVAFTDRGAGRNRKYIYTVRAYRKNGNKIIKSSYNKKGIKIK